MRNSYTERVPLQVNSSLTIPDAELVERFTKSGGPGGQHANKANTRVELVWNIADSVAVDGYQRSLLISVLGAVVRVVVDDERSQARNRDIAGERLVGRVRAALVPPKRRVPTRKTRGSNRRRLEAKRQSGQTKRLRRKPSRDE
ncbi:MAG: aminoacyl-tRNA hydrolase [Actinobacteria bacterium]|nr:aminoacyl-tRNA hydrolase [Actinomycetota bacterium]